MLAFSSDNAILAAGTSEGQILLWNVAEVLKGADAKK